MFIKIEFKLESFDAWSGAVYTQERILKEGKEAEFEALCDEIFPNGCDETEMNDFLWFDDDYIFETLGITDDETEDEENTDEFENAFDDFCSGFECNTCPYKLAEDMNGCKNRFREDYWNNDHKKEE